MRPPDGSEQPLRRTAPGFTPLSPEQALRVLMIDDDEEDYLIIRDLLCDAGGDRYLLDWVATPEAGLEWLLQHDHDVALVDYRLGPDNGIDLVESAVRAGCRVPLIMLTGDDDLSVDQAALRAGAVDFVPKVRLDGALLERALRYAVERARTLEAIRALATTDELTGLANRRELFRLLRDEITRSRRYGTPMALVLLDIDHFKQVNDTYGHPAGDAVLQWLARLLRENLRAVDHPGRLGGEEIAIVLPEVSGPQAFEMTERLRELVAEAPCHLVDPEGRRISVPVTISLGVAELAEEHAGEDALMSAADQALYAAKRGGRNRTILLP